MNNFVKGLIAMFVTLLCWAPTEIVGKIVYNSGGSPLLILQSRYLIATVLLMIVLFGKKVSPKVARKDWWLVGLSSVSFITMLLGFWYGLVNVVNIAVAVAAFFLYPSIFAGLANLFLGEKFTKRTKVSLSLGFTGILFSLGVLPTLSLTGAVSISTFLVFIGGLGMGGFVRSSSYLIKKYSMPTTLFWTFLITTVVMFLMRNPSITLQELSWANLPYLLFIGIFISFVGYFSFVQAIKLLGASVSGIIHGGRCAFSVLFAYLVLHQVPTLGQIIGVLLVSLSIYVLGGNKGNA